MDEHREEREELAAIQREDEDDRVTLEAERDYWVVCDDAGRFKVFER